MKLQGTQYLQPLCFLLAALTQIDSDGCPFTSQHYVVIIILWKCKEEGEERCYPFNVRGGVCLSLAGCCLQAYSPTNWSLSGVRYAVITIHYSSELVSYIICQPVTQDLNVTVGNSNMVNRDCTLKKHSVNEPRRIQVRPICIILLIGCVDDRELPMVSAYQYV